VCGQPSSRRRLCSAGTGLAQALMNSHMSIAWEVPRFNNYLFLSQSNTLQFDILQYLATLNRVKYFEMASSFDTLDIPLIDFSHFLNGSAGDRVRVASSMDTAFKSYGFIYLTNHGIDQRKVDKCFELVRTFIAPIFRT
jgi:hypothetical protein